jgi:hypothetical protein
VRFTKLELSMAADHVVLHGAGNCEIDHVSDRVFLVIRCDPGPARALLALPAIRAVATLDGGVALDVEGAVVTLVADGVIVTGWRAV